MSSKDVKSVSLFHDLGAVYLGVTSQFCDIDIDIINQNDALIMNKLRDDERKVSLESATFIAENLALAVSLLVIDYKGFRDFVADAVNTELDLDEFDESKRKFQRNILMNNHGYTSKHFMEIGFTVFSNHICLNLYNSVEKHFKQLDGSVKFSNDVEKAVKSQTKDDRQLIGQILSSYIYLIRAMNYNLKFFDQLVSRLNDAKVYYGLV